jgi:hypothetical protein
MALESRVQHDFQPIWGRAAAAKPGMVKLGTPELVAAPYFKVLICGEVRLCV